MEINLEYVIAIKTVPTSCQSLYSKTKDMLNTSLWYDCIPSHNVIFFMQMQYVVLVSLLARPGDNKHF